MTVFQNVSGRMVGWPMPATTARILSLITYQMLRDGFAPWMCQLSWDLTAKCGTWLISYGYLPNEEISESLTSSLTVKYALEYSVGSGGDTVDLILTAYTCT
jgi:hypothetical protein